MRMWRVDPRILCRNHLLGAHVELHMFVASIRRRRSLSGYILNNCLEPQSIEDEHLLLAEEMLERGYNHNSPLPEFDAGYLGSSKIDNEESLRDLLSRCPNCRERYLNFNKESQLW